MKKKLLVVLLLLLTVLLTCVGTAPAFAETAEPTLSIEKKNLSFSDKVYLLFAVDLQGASPTGDFGMLYWTEPQSSYEKGTEELSVRTAGTQTISGKLYYVFYYEEFAAKNMTDEVFARAYVTVNGTTYYSDVEKYSILEYAYTKLGKIGDAPTTNEALKTLLTDMLSYGASAQRYFNYRADRPADADFYQVTVEGGSLPNGFTRGLYASGETAELIASETDAEGIPFAYWLNEKGAVVSTEPILHAKVTNENKIYTAVYRAASETAPDALIFTMLEDGTYSVRVNPEVDPPMDRIVIPATYNGAAVTAIADGAFKDMTALSEITLPSGILSIGNEAFYGCTSLRELILPNTTQIIGEKAFWGCASLTEFTVPASVTSIGKRIFGECTNLSTVYYNSSYGAQDNPVLAERSIKKAVFGGTCVPAYVAYASGGSGWLEEVEILDCVTSIGTYALYGHEQLSKATIGKGVTSIGDYALRRCGTYPYYDGFSCFISASSLTHVGIDGLPDDGDLYITDIEAWLNVSFANYDAQPDDLPNCHVLDANGNEITELILPASVTHITDNAFRNFVNLKTVVLHNGVTGIDKYAFFNCVSLERIVIPNSVTHIDYYAFGNCKKLASVTMPERLESLEPFAFENCESLTSIVVPEGVQSFFQGEFSGCTSLVSVSLPSTLKNIGTNSFAYCTSLERITVPEGVTSLDKGAFYKCTSLAEISLPSTLTSIDHSAFALCESLTAITIPGNVTGIGDSAFLNCTSLVDVTFAAGTEDLWLGWYTFQNCTAITEIKLPERLAGMNRGVFMGCANLKSIIIPNGDTSLDMNMFSGCTSLESVVIPKSVTHIGDAAFENCSSLTVIYYEGTPETWEEISISTSNNSDLLGVPVLYYSATQVQGGYWRYVNGVPTRW
ncbi:MAG: leucine-rich repeat domain-containing protein [Ruminococcaceae bacterium]|nr:leucine-rich repeat domain-containing protein [Oscillospiraceae bacterium]